MGRTAVRINLETQAGIAPKCFCFLFLGFCRVAIDRWTWISRLQGEKNILEFSI